MTKEFEKLIKQNRVILSLKNCHCCFGTLARGKVLKEKFPEIILASKTGLNIAKKEFFPYSLVTENYEEVIKNNGINLIIHDLMINFKLYNIAKALNIPQYFLYVNKFSKFQLNLFDKIIIPYPEEMASEFTDIKQEKIFSGFIVKELKKKKADVRKKYKIGKKPVLAVSLSTGKWKETEKVFQYVYDNYREDFDLIFIYGIFYKGKTFPVKSSLYEPNLLELFSLSDTVAIFGAYNTVTEAVSLNKNILSFPRPNNTGEEEVYKFAKYFNNIKIIKLKG